MEKLPKQLLYIININLIKNNFIMKNMCMIPFCLLLMLMAEKSHAQLFEVVSPDSIINRDFMIINIDSIENVYVIYAEREDSIFKILSKKENICNCLNLYINETYTLSIRSYFPPEVLKQRLTGIKYENAIIPIKGEKDENNVTKDLYLSNDIRSRCYVRKY